MLFNIKSFIYNWEDNWRVCFLMSMHRVSWYAPFVQLNLWSLPLNSILLFHQDSHSKEQSIEFDMKLTSFMRAIINLIRSIWKSHVLFSQKFSSYQATSLHLSGTFGNCNTFPIKFTLTELFLEINSSYFTDQQSAAI